MSHEEYIAKKRKRAAEVASGMLDGSIHYLEGAIDLSALRFEVDVPEDDKDFLAFTGVASEIDHLPIGTPRQYWSQEALERHEQEIAESIRWAKELSATPDLSGTVLPLCLIPNSALKSAPPFKSVVPKASACAGLPA